jgi:hypothetical protein
MSDHDQPPRSSLTAEDLELLATADEELKKRTSKFSFDIDRFTSRIWTGERWQQLLQAHLYYDHVITQIFVEALPKPDALNVSRMSFSQKLQFISALGLLPAPLVSPIDSVNNLRNKIAHDLSFELSPKLPFCRDASI